MGEAARYEPAGDQPQRESPTRDHISDMLHCITHVATPKGSKPVLKTMVTTACEKNCYYCPFRAGRSSTRRVTFQPDELAQTFDRMQQAKLVDGLFLSSGIIRGGVTMQDKIIDTAEIIRRKYGYRGYVHLKIMPGAQYDQVRRAIFTFADIPARVGRLDVPRVVRGIESADLVAALAHAQASGADQAAVAEYILANMSQRMAESLREELRERGPVRRKDGERAQNLLIAAIRERADSGEITLVVPEDDEDGA